MIRYFRWVRGFTIELSLVWVLQGASCSHRCSATKRVCQFLRVLFSPIAWSLYRVSTILICRFTLQLRKWNASPSKAITTTKEDDSRFFQMFLGRLDAQITQDFRNPLSGDQGISSEPEDEDEVFWGNNPLYVSTEDYPWVDKSVWGGNSPVYDNRWWCVEISHLESHS